MRVRVFGCVYIGACTVCARSMWLLAEGSELLAWWVCFFFLSSSPLREQTPHPILAQLCFSRTRRAVLWKSYMPRLTPGPQTLATPVVRCFGGVKSKKMFACQPPCIFKGFSFIGWQSRRVSCVSLVDFCQKKNGRWMPTFPQTSVPCQ